MKQQDSDNQARTTAYKKPRFILVMLMGLTLFVLCAGYLLFAWNRYQKMAEAEAITLAESVEALLHAEHLTHLTGTSNDIESVDYIMTKRSLLQLVQANDQIRFAYILGLQGKNIIMLVDSEDESSPDYSPPGQVYYEATHEDFVLFTSGGSILEGPQTDRWGTWYSALIPIKDPINSKVVAALGIDYSVDEWNQRIFKRLVPDILIIASLISVCIALLYTWKEHQKVKARAQRLSIDEALFHGVFDQAPIGISIVRDKSFTYQPEQGNFTMNSMFGKILGRSSAELATIEWPDITYAEDLQADMKQFDRFVKGEIDGYSLEKRFIKPDGSIIWTNMIIASVAEDVSTDLIHLCLLEDITARKKSEEKLTESERSKSVLLSHLPGLAYRCKFDSAWTMEFVSDGCLKLTGYPPEALLNNRVISYDDLIAKEYRDSIKREWNRILPTRDFFKYEYEIITHQGERKWVLELGQGIFDKKGNVEALEGIILDISDRKKTENILKYNNEYDALTGLHNRASLEEVLRADQDSNFGVKRAMIGINITTMHLLTLAYGYQYSQGLIKRAADALKTLSCDQHRLFYTHENRFVFYVFNYQDKTELIAFCEDIVTALKSILSAERIGGGIGIIEIDEGNATSADRLMRNLLIASEKAIGETEGDFAYSIYDQEMEAQIIREEMIRLDLVRVLEGEAGARFYMQFQPVYHIESERITGFEALARLTSDRLGVIPDCGKNEADFTARQRNYKTIISISETIEPTRGCIYQRVDQCFGNTGSSIRLY